MITSMKHTGKAKSVLEGMVLSSMVSIFVTAILSLVIATLLNKERITWEQAGYWIMGMLFVASFTAGKTAIITVKRQRLAVSIMAGATYWGLLLCTTALFFGGDYDTIWETAAIITAGCGTASLIYIPGKRAGRKKSGKVYR